MFKLKQYQAPEEKPAGAGGTAAAGAAGPTGGSEAAGGKPGAPAGGKPAGEGDSASAGAQGAGGEGGGWGGLREKVATRDGKVDEKLLARLGRYATPTDAINALISVQNRISAGELRSAVPKEGATAEQIAQWRQENGVPEAPEKYDLKLPDGLVIGTEDKPMVEGFLKHLHGANANNAVASAAIAWYYDEAERRTEERFNKDAAVKQASEDALRAEWGNEYRMNINMVNGLLDTAPATVKDLIKAGRLSDGTPIMSHPDTLKWLVGMSRQINPVTTLVPNAGANVGSAIEDEIAAIEKRMKTDRKAYNEDEKAQARLRELYDARDRLNAK